MAALWRLGTEVLGADDHRPAAAAFARRVLAERPRVAEGAAPLLRAPRLVLHSYSSTLVAAAGAAGSAVLCARSEPGGEGEETARILQEKGVDARVIDDLAALGAAASGMPVVTGADAVGPGGVVNKLGTWRLARAARSGGGGCTVLAGTSKLLAVDLPATDPFERTPLDLVDSVVTDDGILTPSQAVMSTGQFPLHPALRIVLANL